jgi:outer membrane protein OmpA-like peptidoglycan-associated protein
MKLFAKMMVLILVVVLAAGCSTASKRAKCIAAGAAAGAAVGAGVGAIVGHQGDEDTAEGAAVGVAAGALVGGIIGAIVCKAEEPPPPPPPPAPEPVAEEPPPQPKVVEKIVLNGIQFDFDKAVIKDQYFPILDEGIAALEKYPEKKVAVEGYTCSIGTEEYNLRLSEKRAEAVKAYMVEKGIAADRLSTSGYGEANPVADNATRQGREMNRRVEFKVMNGE